jgi:predicted alpha/beta-hydrolase family hydrolase
METNARLEPTRIPITSELAVSARLGVPEWWPTGTRVGLVLAHDAAGNMDAELLSELHEKLAHRGFLTLRFNVPFAEQRKRRPDPLPLLERVFRLAVQSLTLDPQNAPSRIVVGGIGLGAQVAAAAVAGGLKVDGLACLSYPLHPIGKPGQVRADPLYRIICPILFVQGTHDPTCKLDRLQGVLRRIGAPTTLRVQADADHDLGAIKRGSRPTPEIRADVLRLLLEFAQRQAS